MKSWYKDIRNYGLCWLLILVSCTASHHRVLKESDFHKTVVLSPAPKLTFETTNITDFAIKGDRVIIRNSLRDDSIFMIYSVPDCRLLSAFGNKGRGEGEWLMPVFAKTYPDSMLMIYDAGKNNFYTLNVLHDKIDPVPDYACLCDNAQEIVYLPDSCLILNIINKSENLIVKHKKSSEVVLYDFPDLSVSLKDPQAYSGFMQANPITGDIVYVYQYLRRFDILSSAGELKSMNTFDPAGYPVLRGHRLDYANSITYYFGVMTTENSIYLYYVGKVGKEIADDCGISTYVEEYDWDGNPVKKYKLDRFVKYLGYAKDCFIGVTPDGEAPFVAYKLLDE